MTTTMVRATLTKFSCGSNPNDSSSLALDTDGDSSPNCVDTDDDGDGILDADESGFGTDPLRTDTDLDSLSDPFEVSTGRNPVVADYDMAAGWNHVCASDDTGVICWGDSRNGRTDVPDDLGEVIQLAAGSRFSCAQCQWTGHLLGY